MIVNPRENMSAISVTSNLEQTWVNSENFTMVHKGQKAKAFSSEKKPNVPPMWRELMVDQLNFMLSKPQKTPIDEKEQKDKEVLTREDTDSKSMPIFTKVSHHKSLLSKKVLLGENISTIFQRKIPKKCKDSCIFIIPYIVSNTKFPNTR